MWYSICFIPTRFSAFLGWHAKNKNNDLKVSREVLCFCLRWGSTGPQYFCLKFYHNTLNIREHAFPPSKSNQRDFIFSVIKTIHPKLSIKTRSLKDSILLDWISLAREYAFFGQSKIFQILIPNIAIWFLSIKL